MTTWNDYETALKNHDWTYEMSDDHRMWSRGKENLNRIQSMRSILALQDKERADSLFEKYRKIGWGES